MLEMFRPKIALAIESVGGQPITTTVCTERAYQAKHQMNQMKEREQRHTKIEDKMIGKLTPMPVMYIVRVTGNKRRGKETFLKQTPLL